MISFDSSNNKKTFFFLCVFCEKLECEEREREREREKERERERERERKRKLNVKFLSCVLAWYKNARCKTIIFILKFVDDGSIKNSLIKLH